MFQRQAGSHAREFSSVIEPPPGAEVLWQYPDGKETRDLEYDSVSALIYR
jgi:hypothetical protein